MPTRVSRYAAVMGCVAAVALGPSAPATAAEGCDEAKPQPINTSVPYEQQMFDYSRVAQFATGAGVRVAVIDSGVDATHPQLSGQGWVAPGRDFLRQGPDGRQDCVGHGSEVASIIAARPVSGVPFHGLAPDATIVPVRISEEVENPDGSRGGTAASLPKLAQAITWAADPQGGHAQVINLSLSTPTDNKLVSDAVAKAITSGVVIVAAAGNAGSSRDGNPVPYPAAYPGVIGVGAIDANGLHADYSGHGSYVDLVAPGNAITAAARHAGNTQLSGTSAASPLVAATAALLLQQFPNLTPAQLAGRLEATADPAPGGAYSDEYGHGVLDPYRALTETLTRSSARSAPTPAPEDPATLAFEQRRGHAQRVALIFSAAGATTALLAVLVASAWRRGRRRGWRSASTVDL
jgi:membrane-anchored mycosin MYCP